MPEEYIGTKFETVFIKKEIPKNEKIKRLIFWGKKFSLLGLTPSYEFGAAGNLSFKTNEGYIITGSGSDLGNLSEDDFIDVRSCSLEKREITAIGVKKPSSETMLHCAIYANRPDVSFIFHVHDDYAVKRCDEFGLKCTENEKPYGTKELVDEVLKVIGEHDYIVMKNHGVISLGGTADEAGERIIEINSKIH